MVSDDEHRDGRVERREISDRRESDVGELDFQEEKQRRRGSSENAGVNQNFLNGEVFLVAAHIDQTEAPHKDVERHNKDGAVENALAADDRLLERKRHKAAVREDRRKAQNTFSAFVLVAENRTTNEYRHNLNQHGTNRADTEVKRKAFLEFDILERLHHNTRRREIERDVREVLRACVVNKLGFGAYKANRYEDE